MKDAVYFFQFVVINTNCFSNNRIYFNFLNI